MEIEPLAGGRKKGETSKAVQACNDFLRMGPGRTLRKLLAQYTGTDQNRPAGGAVVPPTTSLPSLKQWSTAYDWSERAKQYDKAIEEEKNARRRQVMEEGLALDFERVEELKRLAAFLGKQIYEQVEPQAEQRSKAEQPGAPNAGERPPPRLMPSVEGEDGEEVEAASVMSTDEYFHKVWLADVKQVGGGKDAKRVNIVRFNAPLIEQYRGTLEDLAKETGGRKQKMEVTGKDGGPVTHKITTIEVVRPPQSLQVEAGSESSDASDNAGS